jgi:hypothetical protein
LAHCKLGFILPIRLKLKSPIGTAHIVAADFNPLLICPNNSLSPIGTTHVKDDNMRRTYGTQLAFWHIDSGLKSSATILTVPTALLDVIRIGRNYLQQKNFA